MGVDGQTLGPMCWSTMNPDRVSDQLLRWHFRQSILANMRGAGVQSLSMTLTKEILKKGNWSRNELSWNWPNCSERICEGSK
jgi:hypothetical protein